MRIGRLILSAALVLAVVGTGLPAWALSAGGATAQQVAVADGVVGPGTGRIAGADRYATAVAISRYRFADPAPVSAVYLARGDSYLPALVAGTLTDGPVLLVRAGCAAAPAVVVTEVRRLDPDVVLALGDTTSVCDETLATVAEGRRTGRLGSGNVQETAAQVAARAFPRGARTVYLTRGSVTADAVAAGMLSDGPILLTSADGATVPPRTMQAIATLGASTVVALGGPVSVTDAALATAAAGRSSGRVAGPDRYATAVEIAKHAYPARTGRMYLARGDGSNLVDAVVSGMLVDGPVILTPGTCEPVRSSTAAFLRQRTPFGVVALGGAQSLCESTLRGASLAARPHLDCATLPCVALTFDDGPSPYTPALLDTLAAHHIPATFFQVGQQIDVRPAVSRRAYVEGHQVANHTWDHKSLATLTMAQQQWEVDVTDAELAQHRIPATTLVRPPYGAYNTSTRRLGRPLVLWDVDPRDWDGPPSAATVRTRVVTGVRPGSIVLLHDLYQSSVNAVPGIVSDLTAAGYTFVTVSELVPGARAGDLIYNRTRVTPLGVDASNVDRVGLPDDVRPAPVVDDAPAPAFAPAPARRAERGGGHAP